MTDYYMVHGGARNGRGRRLHTSPDCPALHGDQELRPAAAAEIETVPVCKRCLGERADANPDFGYQRALRKAANDD